VGRNAGSLTAGFVLALACATLGGAVSTTPTEAFGTVRAMFSLGDPTDGPVPSDWFTVADPGHNTGLRVALPGPDCLERVSDCEDIEVLNTLDGFNLQPRLSIPFDGPIDVETATSATVFLLRLGDTLDRADRGERIVGINQIVWDPETNTLHVESDELLDQHTRYALIVTRGVRDVSGAPVEATDVFRRFRHTVRGDYKHVLLEAIHAARRVSVREDDIAVASVFTTQSVTAVLEKIRDQIKAQTPEPADFLLGPDKTRTVFALDEVRGITWGQQTRDNPPDFTNVPVNLQLLTIIPGAVGHIAFGKYGSPDYEVHPGEFIPPVGTRTGTPAVEGISEIYFNLFLPSGSAPSSGWPVAIFGHGNGSNKQAAVLNVAATMAAHGTATIAINAVGHGFGPLGTLIVNQTHESVMFAAGGRGIDLDGDNGIGSNEGFIAPPPRTVIFFTDGIRQTVADLMQLVRVIEVGMDADGDGSPDLDPSRIHYLGNSLGSNYGVVFLGVEPSVQAGVFTVAGGADIDHRRLSPAGRSAVGRLLDARTPSLIDPPGIASLSGVAAGAPRFNENMPLRDGISFTVHLADGTSHDIQSPVINSVSGAMEIQQVIENIEWVSQSGNAVAYAPHLRKEPLADVSAKSVIFQFAKGDQTVPNPTTAAILRAGGLADRATFFRNDLARAEDDRVPKNPHPFMTSIASDIPLVAAIARGAQEQIAIFFASNGTQVIHPQPTRFFEVPIVLPLPEALNFIP